MLVIQEQVQKAPNTILGFSNYPNQAVAALIPHGFYLNLLVIGSADIDVEGSLESLFHLSGGSLSGSPADDGSLAPNPIILSVSGAPTLFEHAKVYSFTLSEASVHLHVSLTVISDISLFAACDQWQRSLRDFLKHSFINHHLQQNLLHSRKCFSRVDQRIHACIYLLSAFRPSVAPVDILAFRAMHNFTNIIPIIGEIHTLSHDESADFKALIKQSFRDQNIRFWTPEYDSQQDESRIIECMNLQKILPLQLESQDRGFPWGSVVAEAFDVKHLRAVCFQKYYFELVNKVQEFYDAFVDNDDSKGDLIQYNAKALADLEVKAMAHLEAETEQVRLKLAEAHQQKHQLLLGKQQQLEEVKQKLEELEQMLEEREEAHKKVMLAGLAMTEAKDSIKCQTIEAEMENLDLSKDFCRDHEDSDFVL